MRKSITSQSRKLNPGLFFGTNSPINELLQSSHMHEVPMHYPKSDFVHHANPQLQKYRHAKLFCL